MLSIFKHIFLILSILELIFHEAVFVRQRNSRGIKFILKFTMEKRYRMRTTRLTLFLSRVFCIIYRIQNIWNCWQNAKEC